MPIYLLYFPAASALSIGGPAAGVVLYRRGKQAAAVDQKLRDDAAERRLLKSEIALQEIRAEAARAGVDPDAVVRGYHQLRD